LQIYAERVCRFLRGSNFELCTRIGRVCQIGDGPGRRNKLMQKFKTLCGESGVEIAHAGYVAAGPAEALDQSNADRIVRGRKSNRDFGGGLLRGERGWRPTCREDHGDPHADKLSGERRQSLIVAFGPAVFDRYVLANDMSGLAKALKKSRDDARGFARRPAAQIPNDRHRRLLCA
jgi:hypothetical protein